MDHFSTAELKFSFRIRQGNELIVSAFVIWELIFRSSAKAARKTQISPNIILVMKMLR